MNPWSSPLHNTQHTAVKTYKEGKDRNTNSDGGRRKRRKTEDKHSPVKRKTGQKKNGKGRGSARSAEAPPHRRAAAAGVQ
jgi:hypothetical protein